jgi:hypothetical protein
MPITRPSLSAYITPPGGSRTDYSTHLTYDGTQQMTITQNFGRQGDTAMIVLREEFGGTPSVVIGAQSQVELYDNVAGQTLFAGVVNNPAQVPLGPNLNEWDLACTDYTTYADGAVVRWPASSVQASGDIVIGITSQADCGISAARVSDGGFVAPGPDLPDWSLGYGTLTSAWRTLAKAMGSSTAYGWYVDEDRQLHFYNESTALSSGVTFTTTPTAGGSLTEGHILLDDQQSYAWNGTNLQNRIMVQGASQTIPQNLDAAPVDKWESNGVQVAWPLRWTVASSPAPVLYVGYTDTTCPIVSSGTAPTTAWAITSNSSGAFYLVAAEPPPAGTLIQAWYAYTVPIVMQANDYASQQAYTGPNNGVYATYISDSSLTTPPMALQRAMQQRAEYAFPAETFTFNTSEDFLGWVRSGWTCQIDAGLVYDVERSAWGVNDTFLVTANTVTFGRGGYRQCQLTAVRL